MEANLHSFLLTFSSASLSSSALNRVQFLKGEEAFQKGELLLDVRNALRTKGIILENLSALREVPVSYTHLDVYKRQGKNCPKWKRWKTTAHWLNFE